MEPSTLRFSTFLLCTTVLVPFDAPKTALAQPPPPGPDTGPDGDWTEPVDCDYPKNADISASYIGFGEHTTSLEVDPSDDGESIAEFCHLYGTNWLLDCFPEKYLDKEGRSNRWYADFWYRYVVIYLQRALGVVYVLSRADGPRVMYDDCDLWYYVYFVTLKTNPFVSAIMIVNDQDFEDQWLYWMPGDEKPRKRGDTRDVGNRQRGTGKNSEYSEYKNDNGYWGENVMNAVVGTVSTGLTSVQTTALGLLRAVLGGRTPPTAPPSGDAEKRKDQPNTGTKTDVINLNIGELPDSPAGIDGELTLAAMNPTSATDFSPANDETSSGDLRGISNTETSLSLFGRGRRIMKPRAVAASCLGSLFDDPRIPDFPSHRRKSDVFKISTIKDIFLGQLYKWMPADLAKVRITQYKKQSEVYHIDISVLDPNQNVIFGEQQLVAQPGQEITIDTKGRLLLLLYVKVDDGNEKPISFRYGDPGTQWYSNDLPSVTANGFNQDHYCVTDPLGLWDEQRQVQCLFTP